MTVELGEAQLLRLATNLEETLGQVPGKEEDKIHKIFIRQQQTNTSTANNNTTQEITFEPKRGRIDRFVNILLRGHKREYNIVENAQKILYALQAAGNKCDLSKADAAKLKEFAGRLQKIVDHAKDKAKPLTIFGKVINQSAQTKYSTLNEISQTLGGLSFVAKEEVKKEEPKKEEVKKEEKKEEPKKEEVKKEEKKEEPKKEVKKEEPKEEEKKKEEKKEEPKKEVKEQNKTEQTEQALKVQQGQAKNRLTQLRTQISNIFSNEFVVQGTELAKYMKGMSDKLQELEESEGLLQEYAESNILSPETSTLMDECALTIQIVETSLQALQKYNTDIAAVRQLVDLIDHTSEVYKKFETVYTVYMEKRAEFFETTPPQNVNIDDFVASLTTFKQENQELLDTIQAIKEKDTDKAFIQRLAEVKNLDDAKAIDLSIRLMAINKKSADAITININAITDECTKILQKWSDFTAIQRIQTEAKEILQKAQKATQSTNQTEDIEPLLTQATALHMQLQQTIGVRAETIAIEKTAQLSSRMQEIRDTMPLDSDVMQYFDNIQTWVTGTFISSLHERARQVQNAQLLDQYIQETQKSVVELQKVIGSIVEDMTGIMARKQAKQLQPVQSLQALSMDALTLPSVDNMTLDTLKELHERLLKIGLQMDIALLQEEINQIQDFPEGPLWTHWKQQQLKTLETINQKVIDDNGITDEQITQIRTIQTTIAHIRENSKDIIQCMLEYDTVSSLQNAGQMIFSWQTLCKDGKVNNKQSVEGAMRGVLDDFTNATAREQLHKAYETWKSNGNDYLSFLLEQAQFIQHTWLALFQQLPPELLQELELTKCWEQFCTKQLQSLIQFFHPSVTKQRELVWGNAATMQNKGVQTIKQEWMRKQRETFTTSVQNMANAITQVVNTHQALRKELNAFTSVDEKTSWEGYTSMQQSKQDAIKTVEQLLKQQPGTTHVMNTLATQMKSQITVVYGLRQTAQTIQRLLHINDTKDEIVKSYAGTIIPEKHQAIITQIESLLNQAKQATNYEALAEAAIKANTQLIQLQGVGKSVAPVPNQGVQPPEAATEQQDIPTLQSSLKRLSELTRQHKLGRLFEDFILETSFDADEANTMAAQQVYAIVTMIEKHPVQCKTTADQYTAALSTLNALQDFYQKNEGTIKKWDGTAKQFIREQLLKYRQTLEQSQKQLQTWIQGFHDALTQQTGTQYLNDNPLTTHVKEADALKNQVMVQITTFNTTFPGALTLLDTTMF